ncbi:MAG TPA: polyprenyl synthetase family protein [Conexibacter sp.]|jgi:geranylgeranyl pyrophosphate synthase|nr:polyprenyl synthetase family protein [Conexibacter sp.]
MRGEALFAEFRDAYKAEVEQLAHDLLLVQRPQAVRRWLLEPVEMTLHARRNFFRTGFALAAADAVQQRPAGRLAAAAVEIAWTCALMLDDIFDGSSEREGHPCAHRLYGALRTTASAMAALALTMTSAPVAPGARTWPKAYMESLGLMLLARAAVVQTPIFARPRTMRRYQYAAREMNNSTHWAMVAPLAPYASRELTRTVWAYADTLTLMGKIANDLADYCGGSTESTVMYKDFETRRPTFPVLLLLTSPLSSRERMRVERHFFERQRPSELALEDLLALLATHGALERCAETLERRRHSARRFADATLRIEVRAGALTALMHRWVDYVIDSSRERLDRRPTRLSVSR